MSALLTAAKCLVAAKGRMKGSVKLIFQPAEEGYHGAKAMIEDGVLEHPHVDFIYGIHLWSYEPLGVVGCTEGPCWFLRSSFIHF